MKWLSIFLLFAQPALAQEAEQPSRHWNDPWAQQYYQASKYAHEFIKNNKSAKIVDGICRGIRQACNADKDYRGCVDKIADMMNVSEQPQWCGSMR
jgi:hypothetical protein